MHATQHGLFLLSYSTTVQPDLFNSHTGVSEIMPHLPEGFYYQPDVITPSDENQILACMSDLPFKEFEFHGFLGKRRVVSFGWRYDYSGAQLRKAAQIPEWLLSLRETIAAFAGVEAGAFEHAMVTEYSPGAGIGWHRDKAVFGKIVAISLLNPCVFRLRRAISKGNWERVNLRPQPRSAYLLSGEVRTEWEHSIPPVDSLRYSITFRTLR